VVLVVVMVVVVAALAVLVVIVWGGARSTAARFDGGTCMCVRSVSYRLKNQSGGRWKQ
jgi:hypothetical protein